MKVWFERREELAPSIWQYYFRPERPVRFAPGQYVHVQLRHLMDDPRGPSRTFTLTSLPEEELVSFVVKYIQPISTYKQALEWLEPGDEAKIDDPMGDVILPKSPRIPLVLVAGGIGIASFIGMIRQLTQKHEPRTIQLFYALRHKSESIFLDDIQAYPFPIKRSLHIAPDRLQPDQVAAAVKPETLVYISGSERFVEDMCASLELRGVTHEQIIFDFFDGYADL